MITEDTLTDDEDWKCPKELRHKRIDMTWIHPDRNVYALALEHQRSNDPEEIKRDIKKLSAMESLKILIVYKQNTNKVEKWIKKEVIKSGIEGGPFLLINIPKKFEESQRLQARLIDKHGKNCLQNE